MIALTLILALQHSPLELFIDKNDGRFGVSAGASETSDRGTRHDIRLVSQVWQGTDWQHDIELLVPANNDFPDKAVLFITGDRGSKDRDIEEGWKLATSGKMAVAILYDVPNQPIFDLREDDLIAYTFAEFLKTEDDNWPLLFPMAKSASKAMDAVTAFSERRLDEKIQQFIVAGASKRAWTTYLIGAVDKRVIGIAPMVFDFLDFPKQLEHQEKMWGRYSPMLGPYTSRGLPDLVKSPAAQRLLDRVDPFRYITRLRMPKLIILGANDPYWTIDAIKIYWDRLPNPKTVLYVPNAAHSINDEKRLLPTLAAFARTVMAARPLPNFSWNWILTGSDDALASGEATLILRAPAAERSALWVADSANRDFSQSRWNIAAEAKGGGQFRAEPGRQTYRAAFGELEYEIDGIRCFFSTTPVLIKSR